MIAILLHTDSVGTVFVMPNCSYLCLAISYSCISRNATSAEFLEVQIPPRILMYDWDPVSSARSSKNLVGRIII